MPSPRLSFYASSTRTRQQIIDAREDRAHYMRQDIVRAFSTKDFEPRPLDDEPQEYEPLRDGADNMRDKFEELNS